MANLVTKDGIYVVRFRFQGKEFKRSLKTRSHKDAEAAQKLVEVTIHRLLTGQLFVPAGLDPGDFIVSGGTLLPPTPSVPPPAFPTTREVIEQYLDAKSVVNSPNYHSSQKTHLSHFKKFLGDAADAPCNHVTQQWLENYLLGRLKIRDSATVDRERTTLLQLYKWIASRQHIPPFPSPIVGLSTFKAKKDAPRFKTIAEIEAILARGGLTDEEAADVWGCLYLSLGEIAGLLALVKEKAVDPLSYLLHLIPAYTGMRRGEVLRLPWADVDFDQGYITARSRKQSRTSKETQRQIDLHAELRAHLLEWRTRRPKGQWVVSDVKTLAQITPDPANRLFWQPMRGTTWCLNGSRNWFKIGFHTYRHSFASNLACLGIDQRFIDKFLGHTTEEMRKRYQHLFPKKRRSAMASFSLAIVPTSNGGAAHDNSQPATAAGG